MCHVPVGLSGHSLLRSLLCWGTGPPRSRLLFQFYFSFFFSFSDRPTQNQKMHSTVNEKKKRGNGLAARKKKKKKDDNSRFLARFFFLRVFPWKENNIRCFSAIGRLALWRGHQNILNCCRKEKRANVRFLASYAHTIERHHMFQ